MKRLFYFLSTISTSLCVLAQKGHIRPEDVAEIEDLEEMAHHSSSSGDSSGFVTVLLVVLPIIIIAFIIAINNSDKKDVNQRIAYYTANDLNAFRTIQKAISAGCNFKTCKGYYVMEDGTVLIPSSARCIILEYVKENKSYVKVKFDQYPEPLYLQRCWLRKG
jgi:hypothetical protein